MQTVMENVLDAFKLFDPEHESTAVFITACSHQAGNKDSQLQAVSVVGLSDDKAVDY